MTNQPLTKEQLRVHQRLENDLPFYCRRALKIKTKGGKLVPFVLNKAQMYVHEKLEAQLAEKGWVRAIILKGRQQGCSTYIGGRFYHKAAWKGAKTVYILSHESTSTQTLYGKVELFHKECPEQLRPKADVANRTQLKFENLSEYAVGTAGAKNTGRGSTVQYFHSSEAAFYENTDQILTGVFQTVSDEAGTEIIIESTANGIGNWFHQACMDALAGKGKYQLIFVPWYWQDEYRTPVPPGWEFTDKELELKDLYGLDDEQLYWRYDKIIELKSEWKFKQEYPFTVSEAFQSSGSSFFSAEAVTRARKSTVQDYNAPLILGVDAARKGDRTVLSYRRGREVVEVRKYDEMDEMRLAGIIANEIDRRSIVKVFIDVANGYGTIDRLKELGYGDIVQGVHFGIRPTSDKFLNKRAEMAFELRDWLNEGGVNLPDDEEIEADLMAIPDFKENSRGLLHLEAKDKIKETYGKSPDIFDSLILTFAFPVRSEISRSRLPRRTENTKGGSPLRTMSRIRGNQKQDESIGWGPPKPFGSRPRRRGS